MSRVSPLVYVAPAVRALTVVHLAGSVLNDRTVCGRLMTYQELWMAVDKQPGERVCPACAGRPDEQLELWSSDAPA